MWSFFAPKDVYYFQCLVDTLSYNNEDILYASRCSSLSAKKYFFLQHILLYKTFENLIHVQYNKI